MPRRFDRDGLARYGTITTTELEPATKFEITLRRIRYVWRPTAELAAQLPPDFELPLLAVVGRDGARIFREAVDDKVAIFQGFAAGLALLDRLRGFTKEQRLHYRAPFWFYQYVQETQAHLDCNFLSRPQLLIRTGSRSETGECDVLPADLGYDSAGRGPRWTIERLLSEGAQDASAALGQRPTVAEQISFGLMAAAGRNPLRRKATELRSDIRRALFDTNAIIPRPGRLISTVRRRFYALLDQHLDAERDQFNTWFFPAGGRNLIRALARQPNQAGGVLANEEVTGALLHLAWQAYGQLAQCLGTLGQAFQAALPEPLSREEQLRFDLWIMPHRFFGGLPRWMLMERVTFLRPVLWALMINPGNRVLVGTLHRLISWYPEMVHKRREADRLGKQRSKLRQGRGEATGQQALLDADLTEDRELERRYRQRGKRLPRQRED